MNWGIYKRKFRSNEHGWVNERENRFIWFRYIERINNYEMFKKIGKKKVEENRGSKRKKWL